MLELNGITRSFGDRRVLHDVSFTVAPGRMTGFVGGNGAGKTTTMRIVLGVLSADAGTVTWNGSPLTANARTRFGYMPEERGLYPKMKVAEQIIYLGRLHGMSADAAKRSALDLLDQLGLAERADSTIESLSLGLDPIAVEVVQGVLTGFAAKGAPVLFSSHQLDIVERLCDDLVVIAEGEIRANGSREGLRAAHSRDQFELQLDGDAGWLRQETGVTVLDFDGGYALFEVDNADTAQRVLQRAVATAPVRQFAPQHPSLAQIFKEVIK
jgi:ABC-2 type transport system ATP-binding protein